MNRAYRERIYGSYVNGRSISLAPVTVEGLGSRRHLLCRVIRDHFPEDRRARIVEIGCGHGALLHFAEISGYTNLKGIDTSAEQVRAARRLGVAAVEEGDIFESLRNLPDNSVDCLVAFDVIEHFVRDELISLVDEIQRVLQPGGRMIIHAPNGESPFMGRALYSDLTHELAFTRVSIAQLLSTSGFHDIRCFEDYPEPVTITRVFRWILWKSVRALLRVYLAAETGDLSRNAIFSQNFLTVAFKR